MVQRPREVGAQAEHTLFEYHAGLRAAELRQGLESSLAVEQPPASRLSIGRLRNVAFLWTIVVLATAGIVTWLLDRVVAVETVAVVTAIVIAMILARQRRTAHQ